MEGTSAKLKITGVALKQPKYTKQILQVNNSKSEMSHFLSIVSISNF